MAHIRVLDCTLRDGGYVNNWEFGEEAIRGTIRDLEQTGVDMIEIGFMRDEAYTRDRSIYNSVAQCADIIGEKKPGTVYCALIEMANYFPPELLAPCDGRGPDALRYSFWKRLMDDAYDYCRMIKSRGYRLCVQPTRVEQYSDEDFAEMVKRFGELEPYALYIVDTFGLLRKRDVLRYAEIADRLLPPDTILGYHVHNNMGQALCNAVAFAELPLKHTRQMDASIYGMGRGAGNLFLEQLALYLREEFGQELRLEPVLHAWDTWISKIFARLPWGYSTHSFLTAAAACNPNYASDFTARGLPAAEVWDIVREGLTGPDKYLYAAEKTEAAIRTWEEEHA